MSRVGSGKGHSRQQAFSAAVGKPLLLDSCRRLAFSQRQHIHVKERTAKKANTSTNPFTITDYSYDVNGKAQDFIEQNIGEKISVEALAATVAIGKRTLERRFKLATNNTVLEYIQRVKIESAKRSFENSRKNMNEVMFDVGYTDSKAFRSTFRKITGLTPVEYRNKYNKMAKVY